MGFSSEAGSLGQPARLAATGWLAARYDWQTTFFVTRWGRSWGGSPLLILRGLSEKKPEPQGKMLKKEVLGNRPALLMDRRLQRPTWELEAQRAWTLPSWSALLPGHGADQGPGASSRGASLFGHVHHGGGIHSAAGYWSDRWGRTAVIIAMMPSAFLLFLLPAG